MLTGGQQAPRAYRRTWSAPRPQFSRVFRTGGLGSVPDRREPPAGALKVTDLFGKLIAMGGLDHDRAAAILGEGAERDGGEWGWWWRLRLVWQLQDSARNWRGIRSQADRAIRKRLGPMMQDRLAPPLVLAAAHDENVAWEGPLHPREVIAIVREEAAWWMRNTPRGARHGR